jgi:hypothetical protein
MRAAVNDTVRVNFPPLPRSDNSATVTSETPVPETCAGAPAPGIPASADVITRGMQALDRRLFVPDYVTLGALPYWDNDPTRMTPSESIVQVPCECGLGGALLRKANPLRSLTND